VLDQRQRLWRQVLCKCGSRAAAGRRRRAELVESWRLRKLKGRAEQPMPSAPPIVPKKLMLLVTIAALLPLHRVLGERRRHRRPGRAPGR